MAKKLSRRTMLRGMLGGSAVGVALPSLEIFFNENGTAYADGTAFPARFGIFFWGNGVHPDTWVPPTEGEDYEMSELLMPLERHRDVMTVITGMDVKTGGRIPHNSAVAGMLSGAPLLVQGEREVWQEPSIDQLIAAEVGNTTRFRSIETAAVDTSKSIAHGPNDQLVDSEGSPLALFNRLFTDGFRLPGDEPILDPRVALRRSVLDAVMGQARSLRGRIGVSDRVRLDVHLDHVRDLERRIARLEEDPPNLAACMLPAMPPGEIPNDERNRPRLDIRSELMAELLAMSVACDQTRVFSHLLAAPVSDVVFPIDDPDLSLIESGTAVLKAHHDLTHNEPNEAGRIQMWRVNEIVKFITAQLAVFVDKFREIQEGEGTLLESMAILGTSDSSNPRLHSLEDYPILLFGNLCGRLRTGFHFRSSGGNASEVGLSLIRGMGINLPSWGREGGFTTNGLSVIEQ
ncbi:MAG: DUF1552 domain-containing protein [Myxococcota bacterium]